eukprot:9471722-Pyramimonas_sp.AAC.1
MPVMLYQPYKIGDFSRLAFERGLAVVVVGSPAVPLFLPRVRFCLSAAHSREELVSRHPRHTHREGGGNTGGPTHIFLKSRIVIIKITYVAPPKGPGCTGTVAYVAPAN